MVIPAPFLGRAYCISCAVVIGTGIFVGGSSSSGCSGCISASSSSSIGRWYY